MSASTTVATGDEQFGSSAVPNYTLTSDIAQFCFPAASQDSNRKYAYAASIYLAFLTIGLVGVLKAPQLVVRELPPPMPQIIEIENVIEQQQPVTPETTETMDQAPQDRTDLPAPVPVLVAPADAAVPFAVPTEGYTAVTRVIARAEAPPLVAVRPPPPPVASKPVPTVFRRGAGVRPKGNFPEYVYQSGMLRSGQTAELTLRVELTEDGRPATVEVETTSGIYELDRKVADHVKSRWKWDPGQARSWLVPFAIRCR